MIRLVNTIKEICADQARYAVLAQKTELNSICSKLPNEMIATLIALPEPNKETRVRSFLRQCIAENSEWRDKVPEWAKRYDYEGFLTFFSPLLDYALRREYS